MIVYSLKEIVQMTQKSQYPLDQSTLTCLKEIEQMVGSPNYVRTPKFKNYENQKWENFRNFKTTQIVRDDMDKIDEYKMQLRELLNKLTTKTYENIKPKIIEILNSVNEKTREDLCPIIFQIASSNAFFSKEYATLFKELIELYPIILTMFRSQFSNYLNVFKEIKYIKPEEDYDMYCKINKMNEQRRALSAFFANLMVLGVFPEINLLKIVLILQQKINMFANDDLDNIPIIEEIVENVCSIMNIIYKSLNPENEHCKIIVENMKSIVSNDKKIKTINNKTIFKYMDILDNLKIQY